MSLGSGFKVQGSGFFGARHRKQGPSLWREVGWKRQHVRGTGAVYLEGVLFGGMSHLHIGSAVRQTKVDELDSASHDASDEHGVVRLRRHQNMSLLNE